MQLIQILVSEAVAVLIGGEMPGFNLFTKLSYCRDGGLLKIGVYFQKPGGHFLEQAQHYLLNEAGRMLDEGHLKTTMTEGYGPLSAENLRRAHGRIESGSMIGKLVLSGMD